VVLTDERFAGKLPLFGGLDGARFRKPVTPGDQLKLKLELVKLKAGTAKMRGVATVDDQLVAEADLMAAVVDRRPQ